MTRLRGWRAARPGLAAILLASSCLPIAGCDDPAINRGFVLPPLLTSRSVVLPAPSSAGAPERSAVANAIAGLMTEGPYLPSSLDARIVTTSRRQMLAMRAELVGAGIDPSRIVQSASEPPAIVLTATRAHTPDCGASLAPNRVGDVANSLAVLGECVASNDLTRSLVNPADLYRPVPLEPYDGSQAVRAVSLFRHGLVKQPTSQPSAASEDGSYEQPLALLSAGSPTSGGDTDLSSPAQGTPAAGAAPAGDAPAASGSGNPLLSGAPITGGGASAPAAAPAPPAAPAAGPSAE